MSELIEFGRKCPKCHVRRELKDYLINLNNLDKLDNICKFCRLLEIHKDQNANKCNACIVASNCPKAVIDDN